MRVRVEHQPGRPPVVKAATLLAPKVFALRPDVWPFVLAYVVALARLVSVPWWLDAPADAAAVDGTEPQANANANANADAVVGDLATPQEADVATAAGDAVAAAVDVAPAASPTTALIIACVALAAVSVVHLVVLLAEYWSARVRAHVVMSPVSALSNATRVLVIPFPHCGAAAVVDLVPFEGAGGPGRCFDFQNTRYCQQPGDDTAVVFAPIAFPTRLPIRQYTSSSGLARAAAVDEARATFGANDLTIPVPLFRDLMVEQALAPFFVFQVFCVLLWMLDDYWYYSVFTLLMLVFLESTVVTQRIRQARELRTMRRPPQPVHVFRQGSWQRVASSELLPGDLFSLARGRPPLAPSTAAGGGGGRSGRRPAPQAATTTDGAGAHVCPADAVLLRGSAVMNEAMLTGESVPQLKESVATLGAAEQEQPLAGVGGTDRRHVVHVVFGGTEVVQCDARSRGATADDACKGVPATPDGGCLAYVVRTGFYTSQGDLMRTIMFATQRVTAGNMEALYFILILLVFALSASAYVLHAGLQQGNRSLYKLVVPPELPIELAMAVNTSITALSRVGVFCTEPFRVPFAGKIDVCCFDKTGTLTSDELIVEGVACNDGAALSTEDRTVAVTHANVDAMRVMAACHSLSRVRDELVGDPLERAVVDKMKASVLPDGTCGFNADGRRATVRVYRRWAFNSTLKRMSVAVVAGERTASVSRHVLCKGAPEALEPLLAVVPHWYVASYRQLMLGGDRVLALAVRDVTAAGDAFAEWSRDNVERDLRLVGFLVMSTPMKHDSAAVVRHLSTACHKPAMITGDNPLAAVAVARTVGILPPDGREAWLLDCGAPGAPRAWSLLSAEASPASAALFTQPAGDGRGVFPTRPFDDGDLQRAAAAGVPLAITGVALQHFIDGASAAVLQQLCQQVVVFARVSPAQKEAVVAALNAAGLCTLMCGDGTNDVGALKQAHVGVSIISDPKLDKHMSRRAEAQKLARKAKSSTAPAAQRAALGKRLQALQAELAEQDRALTVKLGDASIASPFTSRHSSIQSTVEIIKQGRTTLVTTHQMYKILAINCLVLSFMMSALYFHGIKTGDTQATVGGLIVAAFFLMLSWAKPLKRLRPVKPYSSVFNAPLMVSVLGQFLIHLAVLIAIVRMCLPHHDPDAIELDGPFTPNIINSAVFVFSMVTQVSTVAVNYQGHPVMQSLRDHKLLWRTIVCAFVTVFAAAAEILPPDLFEMVPWPHATFRYQLLGLMAADTVATFVLDRVVRRVLSRVG